MSPVAAALVVQAARRPKTIRNLLIAASVALLIVPAALVALPVSMVLAMGNGGGSSASLGTCVGDAPDLKAAGSVDGYGQAQLKIAATIISVGQQLNVPTQAQAIALMVAMGESGLRNLDHGDAVDNTTIGVFQQGAGYGSREQRLDPAQAARAFYERMLGVPDWQTTEPTLVAHAVQLNEDPDHYAPYLAPAEAVLAALTGSASASCQIPADAKAAAVLLVAAVNDGKLNFLDQRYEQQVIDMANGTAAPDCVIDAHVLQLIVVAVQSFQQVGVSDLNRRCTGETPGAGTASAHWKGKAVDFYALNHRDLTGANDLSIQLIHALDPYATHGSELGQSTCRLDAGDEVTGLINFTGDFPDTCNHLHVQVS
ncbi:hypothetical protein [Gryllotalpicola protaetiae]|uniref:Uncharacterized protein n=1 Tax=Gryllotalpicola protaetiae TaxID=2419771 RepID=A0A387BN63_9MICO|nr:hypothetical protein [Gryllotalpicola protaetiae]AYG03872.1 hypothetical protein D7I44_10215 [Gryllotalpicola protaetiae]